MRSALLTGSIAGFGYWLWRYFQPRNSVLVLNSKVVIVTEAAAGMGRELALAFAQQGTKVVIADHSAERLEAVRREIEPYAADVLIVPTDLSNDEQLATLITKTRQHFGRIDVLVNNTGIVLEGYLHEQDPNAIREMVEVNLTTAMRLTQEALPHMLVQRSGFIVNIGATAARITTPMLSSYNATKTGLAAFSDGLRRELSGTGIYVTQAFPAWTDSIDGQPQLEQPGRVATQIVEGLVRGQREIVFGGWSTHVAFFLERHFPQVMNVYWRARAYA